MVVAVKCPHCGHEFTVEIFSSRKKRLKEIVDFIAAENPTVEQCIAWIIRRYGVRRVKALEYIRDLAETKEIKVVDRRLVPVQQTLNVH